MKKLFFLLTINCFLYGQSNWTEISAGLNPSYISSDSKWFGWLNLVVDSKGFIYAGTGNGVLTSSDNGDTWNSSNNGIIGTYCSKLYLDNNDNVYFINNVGSIYRTTNKGIVWQKINQGISSNSPVYKIYVDSMGKLFLIVHENEVIVSEDNGLTFKSLFSKNLYPKINGVMQFFIDQSGNYLVWASESDGIVGSHYLYKSADNGKSWTKLPTQLSAYQLEQGEKILVKSDGTIFFVYKRYLASDLKIRLSTNSGNNWESLDISVNSFSVHKDGNCYATQQDGNNNKIIRSTDNGKTWNTVSYINGEIISAESSGKLWIQYSNAALLFSSDFGNTWNLKNNVTISPFISFSNNDEMFNYWGNILFKRNKLGSWDNFTNYIKEPVWGYSISNKQDLYTLEGKYNDFSLTKRSLDGQILNKVFDFKGISLGYYTDYFNLTTKGDSIISVAEYLSYDLGKTWNYITGLTKYRSVFNNKAIIKISGSKLLITSDRGKNWTDITDRLPNHSFIKSLYEIKETKGEVLYLPTDKGIYKSSDGGNSWTNWYPQSSSEFRIFTDTKRSEVILYEPVQKIFAIYSQNGLQQNNLGWLSKGIESIAFSNSGYLYCVTNDNTIYRYNTLITSIDKRDVEIESKHTLYQNYPNPFNPATVIKFSLSNNVLVDLRIFDMLGKEVECLAKGMFSTGTYQINFNASNLASGIYYYQLKAGGLIQSKKLMLVK